MHFLTAIAAAALVMASSLSKGLSAPAVSVPYLVKDLNIQGPGGNDDIGIPYLGPVLSGRSRALLAQSGCFLWSIDATSSRMIKQFGRGITGDPFGTIREIISDDDTAQRALVRTEHEVPSEFGYRLLSLFWRVDGDEVVQIPGIYEWGPTGGIVKGNQTGTFFFSGAPSLWPPEGPSPVKFPLFRLRNGNVETLHPNATFPVVVGEDLICFSRSGSSIQVLKLENQRAVRTLATIAGGWIRESCHAGGRAYFSMAEATNTVWGTDGTPEGTRMLTSFHPSEYVDMLPTRTGVHVLLGSEAGSEVRFCGGAGGTSTQILTGDEITLFPAGDASLAAIRSGGQISLRRVIDAGSTFLGTLPGMPSLPLHDGELTYFSIGGQRWQVGATPASLRAVFPLEVSPYDTVGQFRCGSVLAGISGWAGGYRLFNVDSATGTMTPREGLDPEVLPRSVSPDSNPLEAVQFGGHVYFTATVFPGPVRTLCKSDGTRDGTVTLTRPLTDQGELRTDHAVGAGQAGVFFVRLAPCPWLGTLDPTPLELWCTDGTPEGTRMLRKEIPAYFCSGLGGERLAFSEAQGRGYFLMKQSPFGHFTDPEDAFLWVSDGTPGGTQLLKTGVRSMKKLSDGTLLFATASGEVFTPGPVLGTAVRLTVRPTASGWNPVLSLDNVTRVGGRYLYASGGQIWTTDGAAPPVATGIAASDILDTSADGTHCMISVSDGSSLDVWRTDGTAGNSRLVLDPGPGAGAGSGIDLIIVRHGIVACSRIWGQPVWVVNSLTGLATSFYGSGRGNRIRKAADGALIFASDTHFSDGSAGGTVTLNLGLQKFYPLASGFICVSPAGLLYRDVAQAVPVVIQSDNYLGTAGGRILFTSTDYRGKELWSMADDAYTAWRLEYGLSPSALPDADHDADGSMDFNEYAFSTNPLDPGSSSPFEIRADRSLKLRIRPRELSYTVQYSRDLLSWTDVARLDLGQSQFSGGYTLVYYGLTAGGETDIRFVPPASLRGALRVRAAAKTGN